MLQIYQVFKSYKFMFFLFIESNHGKKQWCRRGQKYLCQKMNNILLMLAPQSCALELESCIKPWINMRMKKEIGELCKSNKVV